MEGGQAGDLLGRHGERAEERVRLALVGAEAQAELVSQAVPPGSFDFQPIIPGRAGICPEFPSGILYTWTGLGKSVHTGTYQYVLVQHGTRQYENLTVVRTGMYWHLRNRHTTMTYNDLQ